MTTPATGFLFGFLTKSSLLLLLVMAALWLLRKAEPQWRIAISRAAILAIPAILFAGMLQPFIAIPWHPSTPALVEHAEYSVPIATASETSSQPSTSTSNPKRNPSPEKASISPTVLAVTLWGLIAFLLILRETILLFRISRSSKASKPAPHPVLQAWQCICREFGIRERQIRIEDTTQSPHITPGGIVLLPKSLASDHDGLLPHVLRHEAAHLKSGDIFWIPAARFLACIFWFHPLAWLLASEHLCACEESADAEAARSSGTGSYRTAMARLALQLIPMQSPGAVAFLRLPSIRMRLGRVSTNASLTPPAGWLASSVLIGITSIGLFLGNLGVTEAQPRESASAEGIMKETVIAKMEFKKTALEDAVGFLQAQAPELKIVIGAGINPKAPVTLRLTDHSLFDALNATATYVDAELKIEGARVTIFPNQTDGKVAAPGKSAASVQAKLDSIILPSIDFEELSLHEALDILRTKARELDKAQPQGLNIMVDQKVDTFAKVTMKLRNVPLRTALEYLTQIAGATYRINSVGVIIEAGTRSATNFYTATFRVKGLFEDLDDIQESLESKGVDFPEGRQPCLSEKQGADDRQE